MHYYTKYKRCVFRYISPYLPLVPNIISGLRLVLTLFFCLCLVHNLLGKALVIFTFAAFSDFLDGYIARRLKVESALGKILDPLADKCLMITSYMVLGLMGLIPVWLSVIVIFRDVAIMLIICLCKYFGVKLKFRPLYSSKVNTTLQLIYVVLILACWYFLIDVPSFVYICALIVGASTIYSAVDYAKNYYWIKDAIYLRKK